MPNNNSSLPYPISSLFTPPKLFDYETSSMSPTSTLETKHFSNIDHKKQRSPPIGLGLLDVLHKDSKMVLFRSNSIASSSPHSSPTEFGIKTDQDSQVSLHHTPPFFSPQLLADMELSEDYTCVISHGPNPKTIHIFDNFIVESCGGEDGFLAVRKESTVSSNDNGFLSFCYACKKSLSQGKDIFMYKGEKAFCSKECRHREMVLEEGIEKC